MQWLQRQLFGLPGERNLNSRKEQRKRPDSLEQKYTKKGWMKIRPFCNVPENSENLNNFVSAIPQSCDNIYH